MLEIQEVLADQITLLNLVGHLSFAVTAASLAMRDMLLLRFLGVVSGLLGISYNYFLPGGPLWLVIFWLVIFSLIHLWRIYGIFSERRAVRFSEEERELHSTIFRGFDTVEFMRLLNIAERKSFSKGYQILDENISSNNLFVIVEGKALVKRKDLAIAELGPGSVIGEISFLNGGRTTAAVYAETQLRCLSFTHEKLTDLFNRYPVMRLSMNSLISADLAVKLTAQTMDTSNG
jgi:CRP-like cAMP-binding protein